MDDLTINSSGIVTHNPKITNGSKVVIGKKQTLTIFLDKHFNWFQKKMIKWCFGFNVEDYSELDA